MKTTSKLIAQAGIHKDVLRQFFLSKTKSLPAKLQNYQMHELMAMYLLSVDKPMALSELLGISKAQLEQRINRPFYHEYHIPKKKGGSRQILAPGKTLKQVQSRLNQFLQAYYLCVKPDVVHGFVLHPPDNNSYCNIAENARPHVGHQALLNLDLQDFFPSISAPRVKQLFLSDYFQFSDLIATALALLCTYQRKLPVGSPVSPVISNFICLEMDGDLLQFCKQEALTYTRYADDLSFSSPNEVKPEQIAAIRSVILRHGFVINEKKFRLTGKGRKQTVTGLVVNEKLNIDRHLLKQIRAMLFDLQSKGIDQAARKHFGLKEVSQKDGLRFIQRLEGFINFVGQIKGKSDAGYLKFKKEFDGVFEVLG
jgi:RNA-directed DNA polymerase